MPMLLLMKSEILLQVNIDIDLMPFTESTQMYYRSKWKMQNNENLKRWYRLKARCYRMKSWLVEHFLDKI